MANSFDGLALDWPMQACADSSQVEATRYRNCSRVVVPGGVRPRYEIRPILPGREGDGDPRGTLDVPDRPRAIDGRAPLQRASARPWRHLARPAYRAPQVLRRAGTRRAPPGERPA